jgi:hypothetical protein
MNWHFLAAQCVMCYRTAAAQQGARSQVLNSGILILLIPPIVVVAGILLLAFWKSGARRRTSAPAQAVAADATPPEPGPLMVE